MTTLFAIVQGAVAIVRGLVEGTVIGTLLTLLLVGSSVLRW